MQNDEIISDFIAIEPTLIRAGSGKRLLNYIIDYLFFLIVAAAMMILLIIAFPNILDRWVNDDSAGLGFLDRLMTIFLYAVYMGTAEAVFKGKSMGKLITGTRAINLNGTNISTSTAFKRGLARAVPFCAFSALGSPCNPWQDRWTDTMVMDEKESDITY